MFEKNDITTIIKRIAVSCVIALVLPLFVYNTALLIFPLPLKIQAIKNKGSWGDADQKQVTGWKKSQDRAIGAVCLVIGLLLVATGIFLASPAISTGLLFGGISTGMLSMIFLASFLQGWRLIICLLLIIMFLFGALAWNERQKN